MTPKEAGFVLLTDLVPDAILEMRYFTSYNFVGCRVDGYEQPCALLTEPAAEALRRAGEALLRRGLRLKVYDAYRPQRAVDHFVRWARDTADVRMKPYFYPEVDKSRLFDEGYIAYRSGHSRGSTVDVTLFDMAAGRELDMGSPFDWFGEISHRDYGPLPALQAENRRLLRRVMEDYGFTTIESEWWHFTLAGEPWPDTVFDFPVRKNPD